ncbi:GDP-L-fucose synthase family protein [Aminivibrio sp.]|uniref:GDP-L-fucose synthase family protein n=2 Tax=Aminivibrio sp. TaxID=1872489 RepID=UPI00345E3C74
MTRITRENTVFVAGHRGLVGSAIERKLREKGYEKLLTKTRSELDLTDQSSVRDFFGSEKPEAVILAAARVGGIGANSAYPAEFIYTNLAIEVNVIHQAWLSGVKKLLFLGSSCIYPKFAPQPIREGSLLSGFLEPTNEAYAIAKIAGLKMCEYYSTQYGASFISVMPTNLYGPNDNFDPESSHVLPAMIRKFDDAVRNGDDKVVLWGSGAPKREFLHVDDLAGACVYLLEGYSGTAFLNIGSGREVTIRKLAGIVKKITGFSGEIVWDSAKPDGTPRKLLDISRITALGWKPAIDLESGIESTYRWYLANRSRLMEEKNDG